MFCRKRFVSKSFDIVTKSIVSKRKVMYSNFPSTSSQGADLLEAAKTIITQMTHEMHKGQCGRIAIVGGSVEYSGAPYFAGISALKAGADMSHVICPKEAASIVKSYSPELIVHPLLNANVDFDEISALLARIHCVVVGPGLGRSAEAAVNFRNIVMHCRSKNMPIVIDADGLYFLIENFELVRDYENVVLTPNVVEFGRMYQQMIGSEVTGVNPIDEVKELCKFLGGVTVIRKGKRDIISNGRQVVICDSLASPRRCSGQGDLLSGSLGTYLNWALNTKGNKENSCDQFEKTLLASYTACLLTKECNRLAFDEFGRSMTTTNMIDVLHLVNKKLFD